MFDADTPESERAAYLKSLRPTDDAPDFTKMTWTDHDILRLRAAFATRFNEEQPRTETLFAVAAEGIRIWHEKVKR